MTPYLIILIFIIFWILIEQLSINRKSFWIPLFALSMFPAVRNYTVGSDSPNYTKLFRNNTPIHNYNFTEHVEPGYQLLQYIILMLTYNYFWLFLITAFIVVGSYLSIIRRLSTDYIFSVFLFISLGTYTFFFNGLRQGLAMAIVALATPYLIQSSFKKFSMIVLVASTFHSTALIMLPFYFLLHFRINTFVKVISTFLVTLTISGAAISYLASTNPRYEAYTQEAKAGGIIVLSFNITMVAFLWVISYFYKIKDNNFQLLLMFYSLGLAFVIPFAMLGINPSGPQRMLNYFSWTLVLLLPIALNKINNNIIYLFTFIFSVIYFSLTTSTFSNLTPYTLNPIFEIFDE